MQAFSLSGTSACQGYSTDEMSAKELVRGAVFGTGALVRYPELPNASWQGTTEVSMLAAQSVWDTPGPVTELPHELLCLKQLPSALLTRLQVF